MSYQLGFFEVIKADYLSDAMGMVMMLGIPLVVAVAIIYPAIKNGNTKQICLAVGQALIIPLAMFAYSGYTMQGTGWRVEGDKLVLKAWPVTEVVELSSARAALLDQTSAWRPTIRTYGHGTPGLTTGRCNLANGKKAIVFRHEYSAKMLLLQVSNQYYLISHPGVEELAAELARRGVPDNVQ